jgi:hypothetical protein
MNSNNTSWVFGVVYKECCVCCKKSGRQNISLTQFAEYTVQFGPSRILQQVRNKIYDV